MKIIKASIYEAEQVSRLFDDYRVFYDQEPDIDGAIRFISDRLTKDESVIFLAVDENNEGIGFLQLYPSFTSIGMKRIWILNDLYVDILHRKNKVAEQLIEKCKELVRETDAAGLVLETQNENYPAKRLYYKSGFIKDDMHSYFFWKRL